MRVLILGGDGYLGWPAAMHLSAQGHEVAVADNYLRRNLCRAQNTPPLFDVPNLHQRIGLWEILSGKLIRRFIGDLSQWEFVAELFERFSPEAVVHCAEQASAAYSMLNRRTAALTLENNLMVTTHLLHAVAEYRPDAHIIKPGTMAEYGTPNVPVNQGWLTIEHQGKRERIPYPRLGEKLYHTARMMETELLWFYVKDQRMRVSQLMQGSLYGLETDENRGDERLYSFFNHDEIFGTPINRFLVNASLGAPLNVSGANGSPLCLLHLKESLHAIRRALECPPAPGTLCCENQFSQRLSMYGLARAVQEAAEKMDMAVDIQGEAPADCESFPPVKGTELESVGIPTVGMEEALAKMLAIVNRHSIRLSQFHGLFESEAETA